MDANAWIALAGLAVVLFVHGGISAFVMGGLFQRVKELEKHAPNVSELIRSVTKLESAVEGLTTRFDDGMGWLTRVEGYNEAPKSRAARRKP